jgi:hypothetical protein
VAPLALSGTLLEDGIAHHGRTVQFTLGTGGSAPTCSVTNTSGKAACVISPPVTGRPGVGWRVAGDAFCQPASSGATTIMFAFLTTGADVVGDQSVDRRGGHVLGGAMVLVEQPQRRSAQPVSDFASTLAGEPPTCGSN